MIRMLMTAALIVIVTGCGARPTLDGAGSTSSTPSASGVIPCGPTSCGADEYCFHSWMCGGTPGSTCSGTCPCACGALPDACPPSSPCDCPAGGYYGSVGEVFAGQDSGAHFPDHQVACDGS
jgi:hypothetical protein